MENGARYPGQESRGAGATSAREIRDYLEILRRKWWLVLASGMLALGVTWWQARNSIPTYTAEVLLEQQRQTPIVGVGIGGGSADFGSQAELIRSRAVATAVVDSLGLQLRLLNRHSERTALIAQVAAEPDLRAGPFTLIRDGSTLVLRSGDEGAALARVGLDETITGPGFQLRLRNAAALGSEPLTFGIDNRQATVERLQRAIQVEPGRSPTLIRVRYTDPDAANAAAVVNTVAQAYQQQRALTARGAASRRREVIAQQLVDLADSLQVAQDLMIDYQRNAHGLDPSFEGGRLMGMVLETESDLRTLRFQESLLESLVVGLTGDAQRQDESVHRILSLGSELVPAGPSLHQRLQQLEIDRSRLTASRFGRTDGDPQVEVLDSLIVSTRSQIRMAAEQALDHLRVRRRGSEERLGTLRSELGGTPGRTAELARLKQRADAVQNVVDALVDRYFEAQIAEAVEAGDVAVIDAAPVPLRPDRQQWRVTYMLSLVGGLLMGVFGAFALAYLDPSIRRADDAKQVTGLPLLGMIPRMSPAKENPVTAAIGKEAFRSIRTNLRFGPLVQPRVLSLTSATPREGKTTVAVNLATTLAEQGAEPVLLIDADLRRPMVHHVFGMERGPGLADVLLGTATLAEAIHDSLPHSPLHVLPCGTPVPDASELLGSAHFRQLLDDLRKRYGYIVIDTPPVLAVTDGVVITQLVDGTIVVVRANQTDRAAVENAMEQLRHIKASLLGVIVNGVDVNSGDGRHYYGYYESYLDGEDGKRRNTRRKLLASSGSSIKS